MFEMIAMQAKASGQYKTVQEYVKSANAFYQMIKEHGNAHSFEFPDDRQFMRKQCSIAKAMLSKMRKLVPHNLSLVMAMGAGEKWIFRLHRQALTLKQQLKGCQSNRFTFCKQVLPEITADLSYSHAVALHSFQHYFPEAFPAIAEIIRSSMRTYETQLDEFCTSSLDFFPSESDVEFIV